MRRPHSTPHRALRTVAWLALAVATGCAGAPSLRPVRPVEFDAPTQPDVQMRLILENIDTLGVLSGAAIEPLQGIDIEKVMGRLTDATSRSLESLEGRDVVTQDEIRWHYKDATLDSATVFNREQWSEFRRDLGLDAIVYLSLRELRAQMTGASPSPRGGMSPTPGMNFTVDLEIVLINLESGDIWRHKRHATSWQPAQSQITSGGDRAEQQLMAALGKPLRQFLNRLAPPPEVQRRQFDLSGD